MRKDNVGSLLTSIRNIKSLSIKDFGDKYHTASTEPYFYDAAYTPVKRDSSIPVTRNGKCVVAKHNYVCKKVELYREMQAYL